ncbi:oxidoreductase C-terminal domain-containing protein [Streptomyces sp. NPDC054863]
MLLRRGTTLLAVESVNRPLDHLLARQILCRKVELSPDGIAAEGFSLASLLP